MNYENIKNTIFTIINTKFNFNYNLELKENLSYSEDLGFDSLDAVELMMEFEIEFNISISNEEFDTFNRESTIKDSIEFICKKLNININKMKVKCVNQSNFKNLTVNQEYEIVEQSLDFYYVINNAGNTAKYAKEYFEVVDELRFDEKHDNEQDLLIDDEDGIVENEISFEYGDGKILVYINKEEEFSLYYDSVAGSCGVISIDGLNDLCNSFPDLFEEIMDELIEFIKITKNIGCIVFSTNYDEDIVINWLNNNCSGNIGKFVNPNSGRTINVWWYIINQ